VVDASALITLGGAGALSLLGLGPYMAVTVPEVYRETVEIGLARIYPDAAAIARAFQQGLVRLREPTHTGPITGISPTDSLVLRLAEETRAVLLVNDHTLLRNAQQRGVVARFSAELVLELGKTGKISRPRQERLLAEFVANGRYSEEFIQALRLRR